MAFVVVAAIILDTDDAPSKWHAAIVWTFAAFYGLLIYDRKKWRFFPFWLFFVACFVIHVYVMWFIFGTLLPQLRLGTLYVVPVAILEVILLIVVFSGLERILGKHSWINRKAKPH